MMKLPKLSPNFWLFLTVLSITNFANFIPTNVGKALTAKSLKSQAITCNFAKPVQLRSTTKYGIFGDDTFDTVVCGYLITKEQEIYDEKHTIAYLRIVKFADEGFKKAMSRGVAEGNSINAVENGNYDFSLGCFKNGKIEADYENKTGKPYLTEAVKAKIINSSPQQPVALILSFGKHEGSDCVCCNLAYIVRDY